MLVYILKCVITDNRCRFRGCPYECAHPETNVCVRQRIGISTSIQKLRPFTTFCDRSPTCKYRMRRLRLVLYRHYNGVLRPRTISCTYATGRRNARLTRVRLLATVLSWQVVPFWGTNWEASRQVQA